MTGLWQITMSQTPFGMTKGISSLDRQQKSFEHLARKARLERVKMKF